MGLNLASSTLAFFLVSLLELIFFLIAMMYFKFRKKGISEEIKGIFQTQEKNARDWLLSIGFGLIIGVIFYFIGQLLIRGVIFSVVLTLGGDFYITASEGSIDVTPPATSVIDLTITLLIGFFLIAPSEEFFFRGFLYRETRKLANAWRFLIPSFAFSLYHVFPGLVPIQTTITFFPYYFAMGILLAANTYYRNGDLISSIVAHGTFNGIFFILNFLP